MMLPLRESDNSFRERETSLEVQRYIILCSNDPSMYESIIMDNTNESTRLLCFKFSELNALRVALNHYIISAAIFDLNSLNESILEAIGYVQKSGTNCRIICVTPRKVVGHAINHQHDTFAYVHTPLRATKLRKQLLRPVTSEALPFQGPFQGRSLLEIIQFLLFAGLSGRLIVWSAFMRGEMWIHRSQLVHAECGDRQGLAALQAMRDLPRGTFRFQKGRTPLQTLQLGLYHPQLTTTGTSSDELQDPADISSLSDGAEDEAASMPEANGMAGSQYSPPLKISAISGDLQELPLHAPSPYTPPSTQTVEPLLAESVNSVQDASFDGLSSVSDFSWQSAMDDERPSAPDETSTSRSDESPPAAWPASLPSGESKSASEEAQIKELPSLLADGALSQEADFSWLSFTDRELLSPSVETDVSSGVHPEWPKALPSVGTPTDARLIEPLPISLSSDAYINDPSLKAVHLSGEQALEQSNENLWQQLCVSDISLSQKLEKESPMAVNASSVKEVLARIELTIEGFIGAAVADSDSGMCLGSIGGAGILNVEVAAAGNTEVVRSKRKAMKALNLRDEIEDILLSLSKQYHLIRPLRSRPAVFIYLAVDRSRANLAMARYALADAERDLSA